MNDDYLINLLPSEYLPKPEFKAFPVFFLLLIVLVGGYCYLNYINLKGQLDEQKAQRTTFGALVQQKSRDAAISLDVQARARMLYAYGISIWGTLHQNPPWIDVYNEIEESIPEGMWISSLKLVGGSEKKWPSFSMVGMVAGNKPQTVLDFYAKMLDPTSSFDKVKISGYTFIKVKGKDAVTFNMTFHLKRRAFMGI